MITEDEARVLVDAELRQRVRKIVREQFELLSERLSDHKEQRRRIKETIAAGARQTKHRFAP